MSLFRSSQAVGLHRFWVMPAEAVHVMAGFVMVCPLPVLRVDGVLRLDGVVRVGNV